jgi:hypothetical protein
MNIVSWVLLALVIFTLIARFAIKLSRTTKDDIFLLLAAVRNLNSIPSSRLTNQDQLFSFGQTVSVSIQWKDITSQRTSDMLPRDEAVYQKASFESTDHVLENEC